MSKQMWKKDLAKPLTGIYPQEKMWLTWNTSFSRLPCLTLLLLGFMNHEWIINQLLNLADLRSVISFFLSNKFAVTKFKAVYLMATVNPQGCCRSTDAEPHCRRACFKKWKCSIKIDFFVILNRLWLRSQIGTNHLVLLSTWDPFLSQPNPIVTEDVFGS